jgi:hypothetical protein
MPEQGYITVSEVSRFLKLEKWHNEAPRQLIGRSTVNPERTLRKHNAEDVLAAVECIEAHTSKDSEVRFPTALVEELKQALPVMAEAGETVERMAKILDAMQTSVGGDGEIAPEERASKAFHDHRKVSEKRRAATARERARRHR